jgi:hypothetical protein
MNNIKKCVEKLTEYLTDINSEIEKVETDKIKYSTSRDIRKLAQKIKVTAQELRVITIETYKQK